MAWEGLASVCGARAAAAGAEDVGGVRGGCAGAALRQAGRIENSAKAAARSGRCFEIKRLTPSGDGVSLSFERSIRD